MTDTTVKQTLQDLIESASPKTWGVLVFSGIAQYGASLYVKTLAKQLVIGGKVHQRIAIQVASLVVVWACKNWIKDAATKFAVEFIVAIESVIKLFSGTPATD